VALTTESTVRIKIDLPNLEKTSTSLKNLAASSSDLATGAKSQISTIDKLTQAVRSGSKLSDQQINRMYSSLQEYNNGLSITIKKYNQELNTTLNTISELEQEIDKLTKKQRSQKTSYATSQTNNQTSNVFKKAQQIYGQKNQHHTAEEVAIANGFATYKDAYNVSLKSIEKATPEEQARIKVAREIIDLYKIQKQKAQESEDSHKKALEITNKTLEEKKTLLKEAQAHKKELDRDPIKAAMTVNTGLGQTTDELASAKYDMAVSGAKSAEVINPNS
jgi:chromosome segregation ATPase